MLLQRIQDAIFHRDQDTDDTNSSNGTTIMNERSRLIRNPTNRRRSNRGDENRNENNHNASSQSTSGDASVSSTTRIESSPLHAREQSQQHTSNAIRYESSNSLLHQSDNDVSNNVDNVRTGPQQQETGDVTTTQNVDQSETNGTANNVNDPVEEEEDDDEDNDDEEAAAIEAAENSIMNLTRRLRCCFGVLTWPVVPLGTIVMIALLYFLYAAAFLDITKTCSHPMIKGYAIATIFIASYAPYHSLVRDRVFHYRRDRDGPNRPLVVRRYDQVIHTIALLYVYAGITLVETCREDKNTVFPSNNSGENSNSTSSSSESFTNNSCDATCPNVTAALTIYVTTLEIFTLSLIVPLLFLPCIYLWFLRLATTNAEAIALLQERFTRDQQSTNYNDPTDGANIPPYGSIVTVDEILSNLQQVQLVRRQVTQDTTSTLNDAEYADGWILSIEKINDSLMNDNSESTKVTVSSEASNTTTPESTIKSGNYVTECCICMCDFYVHDEHDGMTDIESGRISSNGTSNLDNDVNNSPIAHTSSTSSVERSPRTSHNDSPIVQTQSCGHLFHLNCIASWISGRSSWTAPPPTSSSNREQRRARRTTCPLCRQDLRRTQNNTTSNQHGRQTHSNTTTTTGSSTENGNANTQNQGSDPTSNNDRGGTTSNYDTFG